LNKIIIMETNIITIGNSKGIIIPSKFLKLNNFEQVVNIEIENGKLIISPCKVPRENWENLIESEIKNCGQTSLLIPSFFEDEQNLDWTW
jgi:antitoxin MazE